MIDKLEVGVKYKLVDKAGYVNNRRRNAEFMEKFLTNSGCFTFDYINESGSGFINDHLVIDATDNEHLFLAKDGVDMEYRVIRKASKHQVCDWRKGVKLYEDGVGTLVRNDKRTKFYTDIVEWREVVEPVTPTVVVDYMSELDKLSKLELQELLIRLRDMTTKAIQKKG
jgi:hypothetical protein